jgi:hypothetical protein
MQGPCYRTFSNKYNFIGHLKNAHKDDIYEPCKVDATPMIADHESNIEDDDCENSDNITDKTRSDLNIKHLAAMFIAEAKNRISTLSSVQCVVTACRQMFESVMDDLEYTLGSTVDDDSASRFNKIQKKLTQYRNPFAGLETDYSQTAYMETVGAFVRPETYVIGHTQKFVKDKVTGFQVPVMEAVTAQYVPISKTIVTLHSRTDIVRQAVSSNGRSSDSSLRTYFDGLHWDQHPLKTQDQLLIRLYGDDFEPANPLGSRKSVYKVGCI